MSPVGGSTRIAAGARMRGAARADAGRASATATHERAQREQRAARARARAVTAELERWPGCSESRVELGLSARARSTVTPVSIGIADSVSPRLHDVGRVGVGAPSRRWLRRASSSSSLLVERVPVARRASSLSRVVDDDVARPPRATSSASGRQPAARLRVDDRPWPGRSIGRGRAGPRSPERPGRVAQALGLARAAAAAGSPPSCSWARTIERDARDEARRRARARRPGARSSTRPPCAPTPGSRNGARGISSRSAGEVLGRGGADDGADVAQPAGRPGAPSPRRARDALPDRAAAGERAGPRRRRRPGSTCARARRRRRRPRGAPQRARACRGPCRGWP